MITRRRLLEAADATTAAIGSGLSLPLASAHSQIERQLSALQATQQIVRQEEITAEIIELAAGETASRSNNAPREQRKG